MSLQCCARKFIKELGQFSNSQLKKKDAPRCFSCAENKSPAAISRPQEGSYRTCKSCKLRVALERFRGNALECKLCRRQEESARRKQENEARRNAASGACRVKDVQRVYGHLCEIPIQAYREAGVAHSRNDYVTESDVQRASDAWDARSIAHDIDTQWGTMPEGGAYSDSNHYWGPGEYDYY